MKAEKIIILCCFIGIGIYVIAAAAGYPRVPNTMSSGFFPTLASIFLVCLSVIELLFTFLRKDKKTEGSAGAHFPKIMLVTLMLVAMTLIMRYVHPAAGILVFLFAYLALIAKTRIRHSAPVSIAGTAVIYAVIRLLHIPL